MNEDIIREKLQLRFEKIIPFIKIDCIVVDGQSSWFYCEGFIAFDSFVIIIFNQYHFTYNTVTNMILFIYFIKFHKS